MPCSDAGADREQSQIDRSEVRRLTALLCEACDEWPKTRALPINLQLWKKEHDKVDTDRRAEQKRAKEQSIARLKRQALEIQRELKALED